MPSFWRRKGSMPACTARSGRATGKGGSDTRRTGADGFTGQSEAGTGSSGTDEKAPDMNIHFQKVDGYVFGAIQPSALLVFDTAETVDAVDRDYLENVLTAHQGIRTDNLRTASGDPFLSLFLALIDVLNRECGDQRFTDITIRAAQGKVRVYIPTLSPALVARNVKHLAEHLGRRGTAAPDQFAATIRAACAANSR